MTLRKTRKLPQILRRSCLLVYQGGLTVMTPLTTPAVGISWPCIFGKVYFVYGGWFISGCGWGNRGWFYLTVCFFFYLYFCSLMCSVSFFFKWLDHDNCGVCFFVYDLFSLVPLTRSYWWIEIVVRYVKVIIRTA